MLTLTQSNWFAAVAVCAAVSSPVALTGCEEQTITDGGMYKLTIAEKPFNLKVSCSEPTRQKGLGGVATIADDGGMIFAFPDSDKRNFWMVDCITDMDVIFLDPRGYVTSIHTMLKEDPKKPEETLDQYHNRLKRYSSVTPAQYAIELRKGRAEELGIKTRQKIEFDTKAFKAAAK